MSTLTRRAHRQPFADVLGWLEVPLGLIGRRPGIQLPASADEGHIQASYDSGVLEVEVLLRDANGDDRHIPVMLNHHIAPT